MQHAGAVTSSAAFEWHAHPDVWILMTFLAAGYLLALRLGRSGRWGAAMRGATRKQKTFFVLGLGAMWIGADWPIHDISENYLFSVHMLQHTIFSLIAPPLLLLGLPAWMLRKMLQPVMPVVRVVTKPLLALIVFNVVIVVTHWPVVVDASVQSEPLHFVLHTVLVVASLMMWWPVVAPLPETPRLSEPAKGMYLFLQSIVPTVPASFLTFSSTAMYHVYAGFPRLWGISAVEDQRIAGLLMKILGGLLLWTAIAVIFFRWSAREERIEAKDIPEIAWEDFENELDVWDLRR